MKVLHIISSIAGGAGQACLNLHQALMGQAVESKVLYLNGQADKVGGLYQVKSNNTLFRKVLRKLNLSSRKEDIYDRKIKQLKGNYEAVSLPFSSYQLHLHPLVVQAEVIHLHWIGDFVDLPSFFENVKKPIVWTLHDFNPVLGIFHYQNDIERNPQFLNLEKEIAVLKRTIIKKYNPHFIATSKYTLTKVATYVNEQQISLVSCLLPIASYTAIPKKQAKQMLNLGEETFVVGIGAQYLDNPRKGYRLFWQSMADLKAKLPVQLHIITFGEFISKGHLKNVFPTHHLYSINSSEMSEIYAAMDIFIVTSEEETFGQTAFEALLCNTPVLASRTGAMVEYIDDKWLFEPKSQQEFNDKLISAVDQLNATKTSGTDTRTKALNWYSNTDALEKHIQLYQNVSKSASA